MILSFLYKGFWNGSIVQIKRLEFRRKPLSEIDTRLEPSSIEKESQSYLVVTVSGNWRVTFRFNGKDVEIVNYEDYH